MSLPIVVFYFGAKPTNSSKMSKVLKPPVIKTLKLAISVVSVLAS